MLSAIALIAIFMGLQPLQAQNTTLAGWTIPNGASSTVLAADCGEGTFYADGTHGSSDWPIVSAGTTPGIYFGNAGVVPSNGLCDVTAASKGFTFIGNNYNDNSCVFVVPASGYINLMVEFNHRGSSAGFSIQTWSHSTDGENFVTDTVMTGMNSGTNATFGNIRSFTLSDDADGAETLYIRVTFSGATGTGNNRMDNIRISGMQDLPIAAQPEFSHIPGNFCNPIELTLSCPTEGASIYYTTDGTDPDNVTGTLYTGPIAISTTTTVNAIAYADGLDASTIRSATYTLPTEVATVTAFKAEAENTYIKLTGELTATFQTGSYLFVQDATAATCIYGSGLPNYANGTVITGGICGVKSSYNGLVEITNAEFQNPTATAGTAVDPVEVTLADLNANFDAYDCRLVTVTGATFQATTFANSTNAVAPLIQGTDTVMVANQLRTLDGYSTPSTLCAVTGLAVPRLGSHRLCPRSTFDIVPMDPSVLITAPSYGQTFEQGDIVTASLQTTFFNFENNATIHVELLLNGNNVADLTLSDATELAAFQNSDLTPYLTGLGDYQMIASLVSADNIIYSTDTIIFQYIAAYIAIETSANALAFEATGEQQTFTVTGFRLSDAIAVTVSSADFTVTPATLPATAVGAPVTVTFTGTASADAVVTLTSDTVTATVALSAIIPIDTVIYATGFETTDGFTEEQYYQNTAIRYDGPEGQQWGTYYGSISGTSHIDGELSMQMRWYTANPDRMGYGFTNFDLHNVTYVTFSAKYNNQAVDLRVSRSIDGGATYEESVDYSLTSQPQEFSYFVSDSGQYYATRLKFELIFQDNTAPSNQARLIIDNITVYGVTGLEPSVVATPTISVPSNSYMQAISVTLACATEDAQIHYTTDGSVPDESSALYTYPLTIDTTCTLKVRAFKGGMDPSNTAFAEYVFPTQVANIAAFKAAGALDNSVNYKITGSVTFVYRNGRRIFIQDATGGLLVYDNSTPVITRTYNEGDVINNGIIGTYTLYNGMNELIPTADWEAAFGTAPVTPVVITADQLTSDFASYEARLVHVNAVTFPDGAEFNTSDYTEATAQDNTGSFVFRNQFKTLDTTLAAGAEADVVGLAAIFVTDNSTAYQLFPRTNADIIMIDTTGIHQLELLDLSVFPNPTCGIVTLRGMSDNGPAMVQVCDMNGRTLLRQRFDGCDAELDFGSYAAGTYLILVTSADGRTGTVKVTKR